jgi:RND superfamily putative drug exporter
MSRRQELREEPVRRVVAARTARVIVWFRLLLIPAWIAAAVLAASNLPSIFSAQSGALGELLPESSEALSVEKHASEEFGLPALSRTVVVAEDPNGLSREQVTSATSFIGRLDRSAPPTRPVRGALPLVNPSGVSLGGASATTLLTYVYIDQQLNQVDQQEAARHFADRLGQEAGIPTTHVTGPAPARFREAQISSDHLQWVELATVALVVLILWMYFRAPGIPLLGLGTVAIAYVVANHVLGWLGKRIGLSAPQELEPVIVALLFGVLTDYVVFFVSGYRRRLAEGLLSRDAATEVTAELLPVVVTAGLMIAGATLTLLLSGVTFLSAFGPGLAVAVLVGVAVAITFVPAALALFGPLLLWPRRPEPEHTATPAHASGRGRLVGLAARHPAIVSIACVLLLGAAASGVRGLELGDPVMSDLPADTEVRQGYDAAASAYSPGIVGPTMLVLSKPGIVAERAQLARLQSMLQHEPGVDLVIGPADQTLQRPYGVVLAPGGDAARFMLVLDSNPESADATETLSDLRAALPGMLDQAGLSDAQSGFAGDTAITAELTDDTQLALLRVAPAALAVVFLLLWGLLRSRTAPLYLVAVSALVVVAALGLTVYVFQGLLGYGELTFFVPIATAILLLALGCDYNVFLVGRIWHEAERRELRAAVRTAGSRAARAITIAGLILALSFAAIALIPILSFRELAFAMCVGLLLDAFVARALLIPALIALLERTDRRERWRAGASPAAEATDLAESRARPSA